MLVLLNIENPRVESWNEQISVIFEELEKVEEIVRGGGNVQVKFVDEEGNEKEVIDTNIAPFSQFSPSNTHTDEVYEEGNAGVRPTEESKF